MTKNIKLEDFLNNHILTNLKIHPSENLGLYFNNTLDFEGNRYAKQIFHLDLKTFESTPVDLEVDPDDYYFYGDFILLKCVEGDRTKFYSYHFEDKELAEVCEVPFAVQDVGCSEKLYFTAVIKNEDPMGTVVCSNNSPFYEEGRGVVGQKVTGLFEASYTGKAIRVITSLDMDIDLVDFDFEFGRIVFTAYKAAQQKSVSSSVFTYEIETEELRVFTEAQYRIDSVKSMDAQTVFFGGLDLTKYNRNDNQQVHSVDLITGEVKQQGDFIDMSNERPGIVTDSAFSKGSAEQRFGNAYYHLRVAQDRQLLCSVDLEGRWTQLDTGLTTITNFRVMENAILLLGMKGQSLLELYSYKNGELIKVSSHNKWLSEYTISKPEKISVDVEGIEIQGWVCPPLHMEQDREYPGVLMIHGGPKMIYSDVFAFDVQMLCAKGYYVFYANPMGSDGRGDAFADIRGSFGDLPYKQLMSFVDKVSDAYSQLDSENLGVTGGSYGGYMTNHIITKTDRFKAAVSERGISNMMTALTSSDIGYKFTVEYTDCSSKPWENLDKFINISPIMNVNQIKTPTLFNHGKNDFRCHYTESLNMYAALSHLGVPTRLCLYEGENHGLVVCGRPQSKRKRYEELSTWFDKYLKRG